MYGDKKKVRKKVAKRKRLPGGIVDEDIAVEAGRRVESSEDEEAHPAARGGPSSSAARNVDAPKARRTAGSWQTDDRGGASAAPAQPRQRHDSDSESDAGEPQQKQQRRRRHDSSDSDMSPVRRQPQRGRNDSDSDMSPERRPAAGAAAQRGGGSDDSDMDVPRRAPPAQDNLMEDGTTAGLKTAAEQAEENKRIKADRDEQWRNVDASLTGDGAKTIYRQRGTGKILEDKLQVMKDSRDGKLRSRELTGEQRIWGEGVKQHATEAEKRRDEEERAAAPLGMTEDDPRYQERKRAEVRVDDPMRDLLGGDDEDPLAAMEAAAAGKKSKKGKKDKKDKKGKKEMKRLEKEIAEREAARVPVFEGSYPSNRFNIRPGHRWDGIDRGNRYERKLVDRQAEREAKRAQY